MGIKHSVLCYHIIYYVSVYHTAATVSFNQSMYTINESEGPVQPVLVLSNPSSTDVPVQVTDGRGTATG